jgi:hypothetical protein
MKRILLHVFPLLLFFIINSHAQNVTVNPGSGSYPTLKAAFDAINLGTHTGVITIDIVGNTTETATAVLNASGVGGASYTSITISPSGGDRTIAGAIAAGSPLLDLNGADNVTIDGLNSGGNSLTIENTTVSATSGTSTIRYINGATNNLLTRCTIKGASTMAVGTNGGNIFFSTDGSTPNGNDNNTISFCDITASGTNLPSKGVYGNGSTTTTAIGNSNITIDNCNFYDIFNGGVASASIYTANGCNTWTITNNKFYQTGTRTFTGTFAHRTIWLLSSTATSGMQNATVTGNIIGYASNTQTGVSTYTGSTGKYSAFYCTTIAGSTNTISNNIVAAISLTGVTSSGTLSTGAPFAAIITTSGNYNFTNNTIGNISSTGSLVFTTNTTSTTDVFGAYFFGSATEIATINNNTFGGIDFTNTAASGSMQLRVIYVNAMQAVVNGNKVGGTVSNSINLVATGVSSYNHGINVNNKLTAIGDTIRNLTSNIGTGTGTTTSVLGILSTGTFVHEIKNNLIHTLTNTDPSAATSVSGIIINGASSGSVVEANFIHSLNGLSNSSILNGIVANGGITSYQNNMIRMGITSTGASITNTAAIACILETGGTNNFYHNSLYVGGTGVASGSVNSFAFQSTVTAVTRIYRNNIFYNARSNASGPGKHYAARFGGVGVNPVGLTSNNNVYYITGTGGVFGFYDGADRTSLTQWQTDIGQDGGSFAGFDPQFINPDGNASTVDLHIHPTNPTVIEGNGGSVGVTLDFDGETRSALTPVDIGADAGNFVGFDLAPPAISYTSLSHTLSTANRTVVVTITDASGVAGGGNAPRIYYRKKGSMSYFAANATSISGNDYTFTIDYANVTGGSVNPGDEIEYYFAAQDALVTPNVVTAPAGGGGINPPGTVAPVTPDAYRIIATYVWQGITSDYTDAANWLPARATPHETDKLVFDGAVTPLTGVSNIPTQTVRQLYFINNVNATLTAATTNTLTVNTNAADTALFVQSGATASITGNTTLAHGANLNQLSFINGTFEIATTAALNVLNSVTTVNDKLIISATTTTPITNSNATRLFLADGAILSYRKNGGTMPVANHAPNSTLLLGDGFAINTSVSFTGTLSVGNLVYNSTGSAAQTLGSVVSTIAGDLIIENTGTGSFQTGTTTTFTVNIGGDFIINAGTVNMSGNIIIVADSLIFNGGTFVKTSGSAQNLSAATIWQNTGALFNGAAVAGLWSINATANNATYNGTVNGGTSGGISLGFTHASNTQELVANLVTGRVGLTVNKTAGRVVLQNDFATDANMALNLTSGILDLNGKNLTINGTATGAGFIRTSTASNIVVGGSGALGTLNFDQSTDGTTNIVNDFTINRSSGTVTLGNKLILANTLTVTAGTLNTGGFVTLRSTSASTARIAPVSGSISGNITQERFIPAKATRRFSFISSPVSQALSAAWQQQIHITGSGTGGTACPTLTAHTNGFDATLTNAPSMFSYDASLPSGSRWVANSVGTTSFTLTPGDGYRLNVRGPRTAGCSLLDGTSLSPAAVTLSATGAMTSGVNLGTVNKTYNNNLAGNWVLVGNPYPSELNFSAFQSSNAAEIGSSYVLYDPQNAPDPVVPANMYSTWNAGVWSNAPTSITGANGQYIANSQAFFVQANNAANVNLAFGEVHKHTGTQNGVFRMPSWKDLIRISLNKEAVVIDQTVIRFGTEAAISNDKLGTYDATLMSSSNAYLGSRKADKTLSIQTRSLSSVREDEISLAFEVANSGTYTLNFSEYEQSSIGSIYLVDKLTGTKQDVKQNSSYSFSVDKNNAQSFGAGRFVLVFSNKVDPVLVQGIKMYPNPANREVTVQLPNTTETYTVRISNVSGKVVMEQVVTGSVQTLQVGKLAGGVYVVELIDSKGNRTTDKLVKQ